MLNAGNMQAEIYLNTATTSKEVNEAMPGRVLDTVSHSSTLLTHYNVSRHSFGPKLTAHLANKSWAQFRS